MTRTDLIAGAAGLTFLGFCLGGIVGTEVCKYREASKEQTKSFISTYTYVETHPIDENTSIVTYNGVNTIVDHNKMAENNATMEDVVLELIKTVNEMNKGKK